MRKTSMALALALLATSAGAATIFVDLGTAAPPADVGGTIVFPFDEAAQAAIPDFTDVSIIPGSPVPGDLATVPDVQKRTIGSGWATWSHGYTGPVFATFIGKTDPEEGSSNSGVVGEGGPSVRTLTLPPGATAFYLYVEPNAFSVQNVQVTTDTGGDSGVIGVNGDSGANGFGFYTDAGEVITTVTITVDDSGFAIGEFGISQPVPVSLQSVDIE